MGEIIQCDFHRTDRRARMEAISAIFNKIMEDMYFQGENTLNISVEKIEELKSEYTELLKEENYWGKCKYWK